MKWFKPKHSVCKDCGLHYEPVIGYEAKWGDLCPMHRKLVMEQDLRKDAVISWASANWEKLEAMCLEETKKGVGNYQQSVMAAMSNAYPHFQSNFGLGSILGGIYHE